MRKSREELCFQEAHEDNYFPLWNRQGQYLFLSDLILGEEYGKAILVLLIDVDMKDIYPNTGRPS